jgi:hypothetical protein
MDHERGQVGVERGRLAVSLGAVIRPDADDTELPI